MSISCLLVNFVCINLNGLDQLCFHKELPISANPRHAAMTALKNFDQHTAQRLVLSDASFRGFSVRFLMSQCVMNSDRLGKLNGHKTTLQANVTAFI